MSRAPRLVLVTGASLLLGLAACINQQAVDSATCAQADLTIEATLPASGRLRPENLAACHDQRVTLKVAAAREGELHLHGYDDQGVETALTPGQTATLTFTATHTGQFVLELHAADGSSETDVGILTIHER